MRGKICLKTDKEKVWKQTHQRFFVKQPVHNGVKKKEKTGSNRGLKTS
jgi:hypothetical protein